MALASLVALTSHRGSLKLVFSHVFSSLRTVRFPVSSFLQLRGLVAPFHCTV
jgi:hypothetical protein